MPALLSTYTRPLTTLATDCAEHHLARFVPQGCARAGQHSWEIPLRSLDPEPQVEIWATDRPLQSHTEGVDLCWREHSELAMGELRVTLDDGADLFPVARDAYARLMQWLHQRPGWTLWRVWHYFPEIHAGVGDQERYRRFVSGRHAEFERHQLPLSEYPAATVIGSVSGDLVMHFIAGRAATVALENPRQVSAYCYPRQYGRHSPSFARARHRRDGDFAQVPLLVSGTSSVVGHRSTHAGDWQAQLRDTQVNLHTLRAQCGAELQLQSLRLYLTPQVPAAAARQQLHDAGADALPLMTLEGDVCRADLSLEIEGVWGR